MPEKVDQKLTEKTEPFRFKAFQVVQDRCTMKVGTDGVLLGAWADTMDSKSILDIGTGTGVIAIMLAQKNQDAQIDAVEIDADSYEQAKENMEQSPWAERLAIHHCSIQDYVKGCNQSYDLVVCNPPFFTGGTLSETHKRNEVRHTVKLPTGELLQAARRLLNPEGRFCVILPLIEGLRFQEVAERYNLYCSKMVEVQPKADKSVERLMLEFRSSRAEMEKSHLIIQHEKRNDYTADYIALTKDFYLNM